MTPGLLDRLDAPIWSAIDAKSYKQALKLVEKRISKKPTDYLEVCCEAEL
jgi:N-terminal acetyltransferase B complex non-catalytic subunit